jgi:uncharacterized membrane protein YeiH
VEILYYFDLFGTLVFAMSGVLTALDKKFDLVGSIVIGLITAVGGGSLRDLLIGSTPVGWMKDDYYLIAILLGVVLSYALKPWIIRLKRSMFLFDTLGIGVFTILGLQKTLDTGLSIPVALLMGVVSAVFGGVIRDVLCNEVPLIFRRQIYASACLAGGLVFVLGLQASLPPLWISLLSVAIVVGIRYLSVRYNWSLAIRR